VVVLATITGLGGGFLRDVLIGVVPPAALEDWRYLLAPILAGLATFFLHPTLGRMERLVNVFDAAGLGLFCVTGALTATDYGLTALPAAVLGMVTGVGGGMMRDILAGRVPVILRKSELYAIPAFAGAGVAVVAVELGARDSAVALPAALVTIVWRLVAMRRGWTAPTPARSAST
jgi:uncharacterized membrane protein YeiH